MKFLRVHFFAVILTLLVALSVAAAFYKFVVLNDYIAKYETDCDPETSSCYVWCEEDDENCEDPYFYAYIMREASELKNECGVDVQECDYAHDCSLGEDTLCEIEYCSTATGFFNCDDINP